MLYGPQTSRITKQILKNADRLIKSFAKQALHLNIHTHDAALHAKTKDGGLGITELTTTITQIFLKRIQNLHSNTNDLPLQEALASQHNSRLTTRLQIMCENTTNWRQRVEEAAYLNGIQTANDDQASRSWVMFPPNGWTGKDYVKAIQLRNNNLPTAALPSNPTEARTCRAGCNKQESLSHVIQQCPVTHWPRINRHNEVVKKIARYCRQSGLEVVEEPHVRHEDGTLYKPDLAIWTNPSNIEIVDVGVNWEGNVSLEQTRIAKKNVYDHQKFREAANKKWPHFT